MEIIAGRASFSNDVIILFSEWPIISHVHVQVQAQAQAILLFGNKLKIIHTGPSSI